MKTGKRVVWYPRKNVYDTRTVPTETDLEHRHKSMKITMQMSCLSGPSQVNIVVFYPSQVNIVVFYPSQVNIVVFYPSQVNIVVFYPSPIPEDNNICPTLASL
jgi:hypothetical protein